MSRSDSKENADERAYSSLRQRFLVWTVAIASSLTSTGVVNLRPSAVWAQEDAAANDQETPKDESTSFDRATFQQLLRDAELDKAAEMLDAALAEQPADHDLLRQNISLVLNLSRSDRPAALARLQRQNESLLAVESLDAAQAQLLANTATLVVSLDRDAKPDESIAIVDAAISKLQPLDADDSSAALQSLRLAKARLLITDGQSEEAKRLLDDLLAAARDHLAKDDQPSSRQAFLALASNYASMLSSEFEAASSEIEKEAETIALQLLDKAEAGIDEFLPYFNLKSSTAARLVYTAPTRAEEVFKALEARLVAFKERLDDAELEKLSRVEQSLESLRTRIASAVAREALLGTQAPDIDAAHFVAMNEVNMNDLKGKVVLLDFWAVWCGPCIATFPHLIEWQEKYGDQGLTIIGVTKFYGYSWDEEAERAARSADATPEDELAMLEKFRESHALQHGFVVTPEESEYSSQFLVTGIPQAVLLDKKGKIRMIRVGSGEANAIALEEMIVELLDAP